MNTQLVSFQTTDNVRLPGLLYEPERKTNKAAIFLHGNGGSSVFYSVDRMNTFAKTFTDKAIAFFPFNNRGAEMIKHLHKKVGEDDTLMKSGMTYELIKDCMYDIDGAINFLKEKGYETFYLIGHSTGANKIVVYNYYKKKNPVVKYILLAGGDDTGIYYQMMGKKRYHTALEKSREEVQKGHGERLVPKHLLDELYSYQSLYDTLNPNGDYNIFPFYDYMNKLQLSTKPLFREYKTIHKPTLIIYGEHDEYTFGKTKECVEILKEECQDKNLFTFHIIPEADHSFHRNEQELAQLMTTWLLVIPDLSTFRPRSLRPRPTGRFIPE